MAVHRVLAAFLACSFAVMPAWAGWISFGNSAGKLLSKPSPGALLQGKIEVSGLRWISRRGRTVHQALPVPLDLLNKPVFVAPSGEWVELELLLSGPVEIGDQRIDLDTLLVPLDEPVTGGLSVWVDLSLPAHPADLAAALQDGAMGLVIADE